MINVGASLVKYDTNQEIQSWTHVPSEGFTTPGGEFRTGIKLYADIEGTCFIVPRFANEPPSPYATVVSEVAVYDPNALVTNVTRTYQDHDPPFISPTFISDRQFYQQLAVQGIITDDEALAAVGPGTLPATLISLINQLPADQQFPAKMQAIATINFDRTSPLVKTLATLFGWDETTLEIFWANASKL